MIICKVYPSDDNKTLKRIQNDHYSSYVSELFSAAKKKFIQADAILNANLKITASAKIIEHFDHRVLQDAHDIIAATYRYRFDDGSQRDLFESDDELRNRYLEGWAEWFFAELETLVNHPDFVRSVVECVVFANSQPGRIAENMLCSVLITHYGLEDWSNADGYVATYLTQ